MSNLRTGNDPRAVGASAATGSRAAAGSSRVSAVLFDFYGTLVHGGDTPAWLAVAWTHAGRSGDPSAGLGAQQSAEIAEFLERIWEHAHQIDPNSSRDESPEQHRAVFLDTVAGCPGIDPDLGTALYDTLATRLVPYPDTIPALTALRELRVRTAVVSNIGFDLQPVLDRTGLANLVDGLVMSYVVGSVKPHAGIFRHALGLLDAVPEETLMVGDSWRDDAGAAALGIRTLLLPRRDRPGQGLDSVVRLAAP